VQVRALVPARAHGRWRATLVDPGSAVVADDPRWLQRPDVGAFVAAPSASAPALADLLDLPLASEVADGHVTSSGARAVVPEVVRDVLQGKGTGTPPTSWVQHDELLVDGVAVEWWVEAGEAHASTGHGLARALAWAVGRWDRRYAVEALLTDPAVAQQQQLDDATG
jgi:hypothetical protein